MGLDDECLVGYRGDYSVKTPRHFSPSLGPASRQHSTLWGEDGRLLAGHRFETEGSVFQRGQKGQNMIRICRSVAPGHAFLIAEFASEPLELRNYSTLPRSS